METDLKGVVSVDRPILIDEVQGADLSPAAHLMLGMSIVGACAAELRNKVNLDNLAYHCKAALTEMNYRQDLIDSGLPVPALMLPMMPTQVETAIKRATRGLKLAEAAQAFLKVYEEVNRS